MQNVLHIKVAMVFVASFAFLSSSIAIAADDLAVDFTKKQDQATIQPAPLLPPPSVKTDNPAQPTPPDNSFDHSDTGNGQTSNTTKSMEIIDQ